MINGELVNRMKSNLERALSNSAFLKTSFIDELRGTLQMYRDATDNEKIRDVEKRVIDAIKRDRPKSHAELNVVMWDAVERMEYPAYYADSEYEDDEIFVSVDIGTDKDASYRCIEFHINPKDYSYKFYMVNVVETELKPNL